MRQLSYTQEVIFSEIDEIMKSVEIFVDDAGNDYVEMDVKDLRTLLRNFALHIQARLQKKISIPNE